MTGGFGVRRIGLVGIDLDDRAAAHHGRMTRFVLIRVVGMDRVGHVHGQHLRRRHGTGRPLGFAPLVARNDPVESVRQEGTRGARGATASHLFVIVEDRDPGKGGG